MIISIKIDVFETGDFEATSYILNILLFYKNNQA